ncbi:MAG TPA: MarR family transcriptional regulator [Thermoleophilia bacterium]|nr:MarR family transcriptional regulator [Thermoleophilia bacterium]
MSETTTHQDPRGAADGPFMAWKVPELEGVDELSARAFRAFLGTARLHFKNMMTAMAGQRSHPGQAMCLRLLSVNDGLTQRDMARMLHVSPPTVSKMLTTMEKTGLVERRPDEADQRLTRVYLTPAGHERSDQMGEAVGEYVNATFATLSARERRDLARLLDKLGARISEVAAAACEPAASDGPPAPDEEAGR